MNKTIKVSYQNRQGKTRDLASVPKIIIANHILKKICGFSIGNKVNIEYLPNQIIIKLTQIK
jgi:hypothetical protein